MSRKHGMSKTRLYKTWLSMKKRCYSPYYHHYKDYGGRGITCDEWKDDFKAFYDWAMSNGYRDDLTLDRIDVNGNYTPENCRFVDMQTQQRNKRNNAIVEYEGQKMSLAEAAEKSGINYGTLHSRYDNGQREEELFRQVAKQKQHRKNITVEYNGQEISLREAAEKAGINHNAFRNRYRQGDRGDRLFRPVEKHGKNIIVDYNGQEIGLPEAARLSGIKYVTLKRRYYKGERGERLFRPVRKKRR